MKIFGAIILKGMVTRRLELIIELTSSAEIQRLDRYRTASNLYIRDDVHVASCLKRPKHVEHRKVSSIDW
jgi:hypothetical protein